jgi:hypothetical protein
MPTTTDIEIYRGEYVSLDFTINPVVDITGWTMQFTLARAKNSSNKLIERACTVVSGPAGTFNAILTETDTDLSPGKYHWDVWRVNGGALKPLGIGTFTILSDVYNPQG